ncbi:MAG: NADPH-dependent FMN reductase, partial [Sphingopyxis terrae]
MTPSAAQDALSFGGAAWHDRAMSRSILVFYGSYRRDRQGIKLARWIVDSLDARGDRAELVDAMVVDLPMLDRRHSDFAVGEAPAAMDALADR